MYTESSISAQSPQAIDTQINGGIPSVSGSAFTVARAVRPRRFTTCPAVRPRRRTGSLTSGRPEGDIQAYPPIPPLKFNRSVAANDARLDRIELFQRLGFIYGNAEEMTQMRVNFGSPRNRYFTAAPQLGTGSKPLKFRKGAKMIEGVWFGKPLMEGRLHANPVSKQQLSGLGLAASLSLNPTRAIRNRPSEFCDSFNAVGSSNLFAPPPAEMPTAPSSRDGGDNVLPSTLSQEDYQKGELSYLLTAQESLREECQRVARNEPGLPYRQSISPSDFSLSVCEVYYEFEQEQAPRFLRSLFPTLDSYGKQVQRIEHEEATDANELVRENNAITARIRLGGCEEIVVYAKTNDRLRFEIRFYKPNSHILSTGYSFREFGGVFEALQTLKIRAAMRINELFSHLRQWSGLTPQEYASSAAYGAAWFSRMGFTPLAVELLEFLRLEGLIDPSSLAHVEKAVLRRAKRQGLITWSSESRVYRPVRNQQLLQTNLN